MTALILDHLWQSTLFALAAGLLTLAFRRNRAGVRYAIWFAASLKFLVPFAVLARAASATMGALAPHISAPALQPVQTFAEPFSYVAPAAGAAVAASPATGPIVPILAVESLWAAGLIAILAIWIWRWSSLRLLLRTAQPSPVNAPVPVKSSAGFVEPGLFGVVHPVILLPEGIERVLTAEEMQAVIDHEVCHLRRRDNLTAAIHMAVQALFWFHPLVWWIGERLVAEREAACDEAVVEGGADPKVYADGILKVCRHYLNSPLPCMAGISGADLKARIAAIMQSPLAAGLGKTRKLLLGASAAATLIAPLVLGLSASPLTALAQAPASIQSAIGAALGAPAQPKLAAPFAAPSVAPGGGAANAAAIEAALKQYLAVASDDYPGQTAMIGRMIELGATAPQILAFREQFSIAAGGKARSNIDMSNARFVRVDDERIAVAEPILRDGRISAWSYAGGWPAIPPGGLDSLASASFLGDLPLHWQAPYWATIDQMLNAGGNGSEAARLLLAQEDLPDGDASSARFVQSPSGAGAALAIRFNPAEPPVVITLRDTESYPGLASLPSVIQALPVAPMPPSPGKPLPEIPATWLTQASK